MILYVLLGLLLAVAVLIVLAIARTNYLLLEANTQRRQLNERLGGLCEDVAVIRADLADASCTLRLSGDDALACLREIQSDVQAIEVQSCSPES